MGSGKTISVAGPSVIFVYMIIGFMLFFVMRAMGELLLSNLKYKSFSDFASDLLGPWAGFFTGWTYWFCWVVTGVADVIAIAGYTDALFPGIPLWIPGVLVVVILLALNLPTVAAFGEMEFWFALIKVAALVLFLIIGILFIVFGGQTDVGVTGFSVIADNGGWFPMGAVAPILAISGVVFAYAAIELVGTAAGETAEPRKVMPKAVNTGVIRIAVFYLGSVLLLSLLRRQTVRLRSVLLEARTAPSPL